MKYITIDGKQFASMLAACEYIRLKEKARQAKISRRWNAIIVSLSIGLLMFNLILLYLVRC